MTFIEALDALHSLAGTDRPPEQCWLLAIYYADGACQCLGRDVNQPSQAGVPDAIASLRGAARAIGGSEAWRQAVLAMGRDTWNDDTSSNVEVAQQLEALLTSDPDPQALQQVGRDLRSFGRRMMQSPYTYYPPLPIGTASKGAAMFGVGHALLEVRRALVGGAVDDGAGREPQGTPPQRDHANTYQRGRDGY